MPIKPALVVAALSLQVAFGAGLTPYALECEARQDPLGIDVARPRLSWKLQSDERAQSQAAYQILVATSPEKLVPGRTDMWDSGRVASAATTWIAYSGSRLQPFQHYWWRVRVWPASGVVSAWSDPGHWTMSVLDTYPWENSWIAEPDRKLVPGPLPIFRKEITIDRPIRRALAFVSGLGFYELRINGAKVGDHLLAPAWTNYRQTVLYETFDVTSMLHGGQNAVGALVGNGFYNSLGGRYAKFTASFGQPRLFLRLYLELEDGTTRELSTDSSWRVHAGPLTFSCIYGGEDFDARLEPDGWDQPGFDDSAWLNAAGIGAPGVLRSQSSPPIRVHDILKPARITNPKPGVFVYDLSQNFAGIPNITTSGPPGAQVRLTTGELLDAAGMVTQRSSGGPTYFTYTLRGSGRESWAPRFSYSGFRYVQVEGAAPESTPLPSVPVLHKLEGQFIYIDARRTGYFSCSNTLLNRIHMLIDAAVRSNLQHVITDCPHREKLGWLEVPYLLGPALTYDWDLRTVLPKIIRDMREAQTATGFVPNIAPIYGAHSGAFRDSPEWGSALVFLPWLDWQLYADRQPLEDSYPSMGRYAEFLETRTTGHLLNYGLGDWYDIGPGVAGPSKLTPLGLTATATYFRDLEILRDSAHLLGRETEAREFVRAAALVREAFQGAFYKPAEGDYATGSQTSLAMPLVFELAPGSARSTLVKRLVADIRQRGDHVSSGDIGFHYLVAALLSAGRSDVLFDTAQRTDPPSYGAQLAAGATSLTEARDSDPDSSQNHCMLGHIEEWFFAGLAGIRPDVESPGLRHIQIHPELVGDLTQVDAKWDTFRGPVAVNWNIEGTAFTLRVDIPPGMTAEVSLPASPGSVATEGGQLLLKASGVRILSQQDGRRLVAVGSGHYDFEVRGFHR